MNYKYILQEKMYNQKKYSKSLYKNFCQHILRILWLMQYAPTDAFYFIFVVA